MSIQFYVLNAFGARPFGGNPAAVFLNAENIPENSLQAIARQLNLIETVYVYASTNSECRYRFRYFTPVEELPIAGHPTIAAWCALMLFGGSSVGGNREQVFLQETGLGVVEIRVSLAGDSYHVLMKQPKATFLHEVNDLSEVAAAIGLEVADIDLSLPVQGVSVGLGHLGIPIRSRAALLRARMDIGKTAAVCSRAGVREAQLFCFDPHESCNDLHTRNFTPREGVEDPACGNGNGALGAYLARWKYAATPKFTLRAEQGYVVNMPSLTEIVGNNTPYSETEIWIGGGALPMIEGRVLIELWSN